MKFSAIAGAGALAAIIGFGQAALADVNVRINGDLVDFSPPPIVQGGRVFVPLRGVFERLGASVVYSNGNIDAQGAGRDISLHIDSTSATINGQPEILDVAPFIVGESTYVPLRFVSEALGASVNYDDADSDVSITTAGNTPDYQPPVSDAIDNDGTYASYAPPPLPSYAQPELADPNEIWQPGYWRGARTATIGFPAPGWSLRRRGISGRPVTGTWITRAISGARGSGRLRSASTAA